MQEFRKEIENKTNPEIEIYQINEKQNGIKRSRRQSDLFYPAPSDVHKLRESPSSESKVPTPHQHQDRIPMGVVPRVRSLEALEDSTNRQSQGLLACSL